MILLWSVLWCRVLVVQLRNWLNRLLAKSLRTKALFFGCSCRRLDVVKTSTVVVERSWPLCFVYLVLSHTHTQICPLRDIVVCLIKVAMSHLAMRALHLNVEAVVLTSCTLRRGMEWWPIDFVLVSLSQMGTCQQLTYFLSIAVCSFLEQVPATACLPLAPTESRWYNSLLFILLGLCNKIALSFA